MGFFFRRSIKIGPFRLNFSKSGIGASVGTRGFRTGVSATGRRTTRVTIPGTGIGYEHTHRDTEPSDRQIPVTGQTSGAGARILVLLIMLVIAIVIANL